MKKILCLFVFLSFALLVKAQCNTDHFVEKGIKDLQSKGGFTYLKSYPINGKDGKKYSYIFSVGTKYLITLANNDAHTKGVFITLFDSNNKQVATSFLSGKFYSEILFTCKTTGVYHIKFSFEETNDFCAAGVLGMKR